MKQILVYFLIVLFSVITGWITFIPLIFVSIFTLFGVSKKVVGYTSILLGGALTLYLFSLLFKALDVEFGILAIIIAIISSILMLFYRISIGRQKQHETNVITLEIIGIIIAGFILLY